MMNPYLWIFVLHLLSFKAYSSANVLTTSSDKATTGIDFIFTCNISSFNYLVSIYRDNIRECRVRVPCRLYNYNLNYTCTCNDTPLILTIPGTFDIDNLHGSTWICNDVFHSTISNTVLLNVNVPIKKVNLKAIPIDTNPTDILYGSRQQFICTTDAGRPSSKIQWYMSGVNITDEAVVQPDACIPGCNDKVISSNVFMYIGHITDNRKRIYCTASNIDAELVQSQDIDVNIVFKPVILEISNYNIPEGSNLIITPTIEANPDHVYTWWTRQNNPEFTYFGTNLTIRSIQRVSSDNYTCHAMNTITAPGHPTQNRTSEEKFNVNVQFLQRHRDAINNTAVGVGTGIAVIIVIIGVLNIFLYRKRRLSKKKETSQTEKHFYNELGDLKTDAKKPHKSQETSTNCYEDVDEVKSNRTGYVYENMKISDNEKQIHQRDPALYVNYEL